MAEITASNKGKPCRYVDGYSMFMHKMLAKETLIRWRCSKYTTCKAYGVSATLEGGFKLLQKHNHVPDTSSPKRQRKQALKEAASANRATPSMTLAADAHEHLDEAAIQSMPSQRALQQTVNRVRKVQGAALADKKPDELVLPEELTKTLRGEKFLLVDSREAEPDQAAFFAFASPHGVQLLKDHKEWCVDGTFYAAAKHFDNLLTINVLIGQSSFPAVYVLLPDRREATYRRAFQAIYSTPELTGVVPTSYLTDFEKALQNILKEMFPRARGRLCHFHQCQAYFKNIQKKGLLPLYDVEEVKVLFRCYGALALLPVEDVIAGYNVVTRAIKALIPSKIPHNYRQNVNAYCTYVCKTYIGTMVGGRLVRSRYNYSDWNCFQQTIHGDARTNNALEGWHAWLNARFPRAHLPMTQFIIRIQKEDERTFNLVTRQRLNPAEHARGRPSSHTERQRNLQALAIAYGDTPQDERDVLQYLRSAQYHLSPSAWKRLREEKENDEPEPLDLEQEAGASQRSIPEDAEASASQRSIPQYAEPGPSQPLLPTQASQHTSPLRPTCSTVQPTTSPASAAYNRQLRPFSFFEEGEFFN